MRGRSGRERCREGEREGIKQARQAEEGGTKLQRSVALSVQGFLAWREMEEAAAAAATLSAAPARMLWPARKGDHDLTAMSVLRACCGEGERESAWPS